MNLTYPLVQVTWVDTTGDDTWDDIEAVVPRVLDDMRDPCTSVGFLLQETADALVIAQTLHNNKRVFHVIAIPRGCVTSIDYLHAG